MLTYQLFQIWTSIVIFLINVVFWIGNDLSLVNIKNTLGQQKKDDKRWGTTKKNKSVDKEWQNNNKQ